jgi:hypothetical protein
MHCNQGMKQVKNGFSTIIVVSTDSSDKALVAIDEGMDDNLVVYKT